MFQIDDSFFGFIQALFKDDELGFSPDWTRIDLAFPDNVHGVVKNRSKVSVLIVGFVRIQRY